MLRRTHLSHATFNTLLMLHRGGTATDPNTIIGAQVGARLGH
jgi:hypothetical protein